MKGHLKQCVSYWEFTISAPRFVLDVISEAYKLPFIRVPDSCYIRNNRLAENHPNFVEEAISKSLVNDCIHEHLEPSYYVSPLSVAETKKLRLVIDLRHVNPCLYKHSSFIVCPKFLNKITGFLPGILSQGTITWIFI